MSAIVSKEEKKQKRKIFILLSLTTLTSVLFLVYGISQKREADFQKSFAERSFALAIKAQKEAEEQKKLAEANKELAEANREIAEQNALEAKRMQAECASKKK